jgi:hypothetical protein
MKFLLTSSGQQVNERAIAAERLRQFANKIQGFCFYWNEAHRRGHCKEVNGRYCTFCELSDEFDEIRASLS